MEVIKSLHTESTNYISEKKSTSFVKLRNGKQPSSYQKLVESLRCDHRVQWELALGKRVGFYTLRGELGCGNFSRVRAGVHTLTKEKVAIKILDKRKMDKKTKRLLSREISSMEKLHHPNIVHLYEVIHTETKLHLVMEYASGGELFTKLSTQGMMSETDAKIIFAQIVSAVQHMHQHNVIHRDLKAENVFYSEKKFVKVGDFGFSTESSGTKQALNTFCGSPPYAAPELFRDSFYYGESVDIWALGVMLYFAVTGTMPFRAETVGKLKKRIIAGQYSIPSHVSHSCRKLIRGILMPSPADRLSIADIKSSEWLGTTAYPKPMGYYRLEPTKINLNNCRPEEAYALFYLDKLGLGRDQLKEFTFPSDSSQSPFSWDAKSEPCDKQLVTRKILLNGSRSSQANVGEQVEINENSALVGTYRILLLKAHKRFCGPSAEDELRKLRIIVEQALVKNGEMTRDESNDESSGTCLLCETTSIHDHAITDRLAGLKAPENGNAKGDSTSRGFSSTITSKLESTGLHAENGSVGLKTGRDKPMPQREHAVTKSKFCAIL